MSGDEERKGKLPEEVEKKLAEGEDEDAELTGDELEISAGAHAFVDVATNIADPSQDLKLRRGRLKGR